MMMTRLIGLAAACSFACGDDAANSPDAGADPDAATNCRAPAAEDRPRFVVVAHPYTAQSERSNQYEVIQLSPSGELARFDPPRTFELTRATFGTIQFTPDGKLGLLAGERGELAAFALDDAGMPTVVSPAVTATFYATRIAVHPSGNVAHVVDGNTRENDGGIYAVTIGCDNALADQGLVIPADFPGGFHHMPTSPGHAILAARGSFDGTPLGDDVHRILLDGDPPGRLAGADAFGDDEAIFGASAITHDGKFFVVGDTNAGGNQRIAIVAIDDAGITPNKVIMPFADPQGMAASPFGDVVIATSTLESETIRILDRNGPQGTWRDAGEVAYAGADPQLPGDVVAITRGSLAGHVFVAELGSIRHLRFLPDGSVEDLGSLQFGDGVENIVGAIGVTP